MLFLLLLALAEARYARNLHGVDEMRYDVITKTADCLEGYELTHHTCMDSMCFSTLWLSHKDHLHVGGLDCVLHTELDETVHSTGYFWHNDRLNQLELPLDTNSTQRGPGTGQVIYVIDSGVRTTHIEFANAVDRAQHAYDFVNNRVDTTPSATLDASHGTQVAALAAGHSAGQAYRAVVKSLRVLDETGSGSASDLVQALLFVVNNAPSVSIVNLSLGFSRGVFPVSVELAVASVVEAGHLVVVAAGNDGDDACEYSPGYLDTVITVGATDRDDNRAGFSNFGDCVDVYAPGVSILTASALDDLNYRLVSGTSYAAPLVAGLAAQILAEHPQADVKETLVNGSSSKGVANSLSVAVPFSSRVRRNHSNVAYVFVALITLKTLRH